MFFPPEWLFKEGFDSFLFILIFRTARWREMQDNDYKSVSTKGCRLIIINIINNNCLSMPITDCCSEAFLFVQHPVVYNATNHAVLGEHIAGVS